MIEHAGGEDKKAVESVVIYPTERSMHFRTIKSIFMKVRTGVLICLEGMVMEICIVGRLNIVEGIGMHHG